MLTDFCPLFIRNSKIEILSKKSVFGKQIAEVKILSTGEVKFVLPEA